MCKINDLLTSIGAPIMAYSNYRVCILLPLLYFHFWVLAVWKIADLSLPPCRFPLHFFVVPFWIGPCSGVL